MEFIKNKQNISAVIIGNEILAGRRKDAHLENTTKALSQRGLRLSEAVFIADEMNNLINTYQRLIAQKHIILSFGGIGATPDDRTREAVARVLGLNLEFHPQGLAILENRFKDKLNNERKKLIEFPQGATLIPNPINEIPGFSIQNIHCVPGFPQMAEPMINWVLDTYCLDLAEKWLYQSIMVEIAESEIIELMQLMEQTFPELSVSSLPQISHKLEFGIEGEIKNAQKAMIFAQNWLNERGYKFYEIQENS